MVPTHLMGRLGAYGGFGMTPLTGTPEGSKIRSVKPSVVRSVSTTSAHGGKRESVVEAARRRRVEARERGFKMKNGKKHHPRSKADAPYPRDYERKVTDHDIWEHTCAVYVVKKWYFHVFDTPPTKVLDLGCGTGHWVIQCAQEWKDTHFVGFDLVPLQPNLTRLGGGSLASRIEWVLGNFLEPLPFADGEFDFVHVKRVARGVPENRWDMVFEEVKRVLKSGGKFEIIEEDIFFPGSAVTGEDEDESGDDDGKRESGSKLGCEEMKPGLTQPPPTASSTTPALRLPNLMEESLGPGPMIGKGTGSTPPAVPVPRRTSRPSTMNSSLSMRDRGERARSVDGSEGTVTAHSDSSKVTDIPSDPPMYGVSTEMPPSHPANPTPTQSRNLIQDRPRMSLDSWRARGRSVPDILLRSTDEHKDEAVLETAYNELHAARFINLAPLAVLNSTLVMHFKDVRSHVPLHIVFPPTLSPGSVQKKDEPEASKLGGHGSPFTTSLRSPPLSPSSTKSPSQSQSSDRPPPTDTSETPCPAAHTTEPILALFRPLGKAAPHRETVGFSREIMGIDSGALHIHLAARVAEVLACAEEMWEFILECKETPARERTAAIATLAAVSREEWEDCLTRYALDMDDKIGMAGAVKNRLGWSMREGALSAERKAFEDAVAKWETLCRRRGQTPGEDTGKTPRTRHVQPLSRIIKVFVAWKQ
ncbi:hypothetical protein JB92DRAFT_18427 [Gautieria morchelliformis]|nr:hypothetical protein JB92DRAFT_18427 [Gautieria morchelliformis]